MKELNENDNKPTDVYFINVSGNSAQISWKVPVKHGYKLLIHSSASEKKDFKKIKTVDATDTSTFVSGSGRTFFRVSTKRIKDGTESLRSSQFAIVNFD